MAKWPIFFTYDNWHPVQAKAWFISNITIVCINHQADECTGFSGGLEKQLKYHVLIRGGWEFDHSHGAGTSSPSHWQQVEEQAPKPVGWTMCFLLMTLVPVQKLCVNIYVYIYVYIPYTSSVIGRIYNGSVIQYWRSCTPSRSIGECAVPDLNAILCFLWFTNCVLLFDHNLILGCLWHCVFV